MRVAAVEQHVRDPPVVEHRELSVVDLGRGDEDAAHACRDAIERKSLTVAVEATIEDNGKQACGQRPPRRLVPSRRTPAVRGRYDHADECARTGAQLSGGLIAHKSELADRLGDERNRR